MISAVIAIIVCLSGCIEQEASEDSTKSSELVTSSHVVSAKNLNYLTEQLPPFNFQEDGELKGISVDLLEGAWRIMGADLNRSIIEVLPWKESYERTLKKENTVLFSTARLPQRENLFKWAGPIGPANKVLLARKDRNISISSNEDLKKYRIAAISDDSAVQMLIDRGLKQEDLILESTSRAIIEMLENRSIDAWAYGDTAGFWLINDLGANTSDFEVAYVLAQTEYYYAFSKETPDSLVQSFQEAIDYLKNNRAEDRLTDYERILSKTY